VSLVEYGTEKSAFKLAYKAHQGQKDLAGEQYFLHVVRVAGMFPEESQERLVALLHDVVEDSSVKIEAIEKQFGVEVASAVEALTRRNDAEKGVFEPYPAYIERVCQNQMAMRVKLADLKDHLAPEREATLSRNSYDRYWRAFWRIVFETLKARK